MIWRAIPLLLLPLLLMVREPPQPDACREEEIDLSQARLMVDFLEAVSSQQSAEELLDPLMEAEGTDLIIAQMNLVRRVSPDQYRQLLSGLVAGSPPQIQPVDSTRRAWNGVEGPQRDVWPALNWALTHTSVLRIDASHSPTLRSHVSQRWIQHPVASLKESQWTPFALIFPLLSGACAEAPSSPSPPF